MRRGNSFIANIANWRCDGVESLGFRREEGTRVFFKVFSFQSLTKLSSVSHRTREQSASEPVVHSHYFSGGWGCNQPHLSCFVTLLFFLVLSCSCLVDKPRPHHLQSYPTFASFQLWSLLCS